MSGKENCSDEDGFNSVEELKAGNPNKVFNDLEGMRKNIEDVAKWFG